MILLQTPRLTLRRLTADDFDRVYQLDSDPVVTRYVLGVRTREEVAQYLTEVVADYDLRPGLGRWAMIERATGAFLGIALLKPLEDSDHIEVGYRMHIPYWGRGYATEVARALVRYGFEQVGLARIVGITNPENVPSQHVLQKCGLRFEGMAQHYGRAVRFYALDAPTR